MDASSWETGGEPTRWLSSVHYFIDKDKYDTNEILHPVCSSDARRNDMRGESGCVWSHKAYHSGFC